MRIGCAGEARVVGEQGGVAMRERRGRGGGGGAGRGDGGRCGGGWSGEGQRRPAPGETVVGLVAGG